LVDPIEFFDRKKPWSKYKDLILDYYLQPYLAKVRRIGRPVLVVDCFAGAGRFEDGEEGSPLIIARHLHELHGHGASVLGMFIESNDNLHKRLKENLAPFEFPIVTRLGDFHAYVEEIQSYARTHSTFLFVDPIRPRDLRFHDLALVYDKLRSGRSVETLVNFLSTGFVRRALGLLDRARQQGVLLSAHPEVTTCDSIAGGTYWQQIVLEESLSQRERIHRVAQGYADSLHQWFQYVLPFPIRQRYGDEQPKYHLIFGSRHPDALELMNCAMVKARREIVDATFVDGMLFPNQPGEEVVDPALVEDLIVRTSTEVGRTTWKLLRVAATISAPCKYTEAELNRAIKAAIKSKRVLSTSTGQRIEKAAEVWPVARKRR